MKSTIVETILKLFSVSNEEAELHAAEFIDLVKAKGRDVNKLSVIENQIPKVFGHRLEWRNNQVRLEKGL